MYLPTVWEPFLLNRPASSGSPPYSAIQWLRSSKACLPHLKLSTKWCVSTWMGDHLGTVSGWSAEHCGVTGQCKDSGVGNRGTHLFLCNGKEMSLCPAHTSCKTTHHLSYEDKTTQPYWLALLVSSFSLHPPLTLPSPTTHPESVNISSNSRCNKTI